MKIKYFDKQVIKIGNDKRIVVEVRFKPQFKKRDFDHYIYGNLSQAITAIHNHCKKLKGYRVCDCGRIIDEKR